MTTVLVVFDLESDPPELLGTWMPPRDDDEGIVRYYDSSADEGEHIAPEDCVKVIGVEVTS